MICMECSNELPKYKQKYCSSQCYRAVNSRETYHLRLRWQQENKDKMKKSQDKYRRNNLSKMAAKEARNRATRYSATPPWVDKELLSSIEVFYHEARAKGLEIDH